MSVFGDQDDFQKIKRLVPVRPPRLRPLEASRVLSRSLSLFFRVIGIAESFQSNVLIYST